MIWDRRWASLFLSLGGCSDDFTRDPVDAGARDRIETPELEAGKDALETLDTSIDVQAESATETGSDAPTCGADGGMCSPGSCCQGLHCSLNACTHCKQDGLIAVSASECCNPSGFSNYACGGVKTCAAPNYDKCGISNQNLPCCGGAQCKLIGGGIYACACGGTDAPCHMGNDFECCSNVCGQGGWCK